jgi:hypothetical protein
MDIALTLVPVILIGGYFIAAVTFIFHALTSHIPHKTIWLLLLLFTGPLGVIGYYFAIYSDKKLNQRPIPWRTVWIIALITMGLIVCVSLLSLPVQKHSVLPEVPLSEVIRQANNGEISQIIVRGDELTIIQKGADQPTARSRKAPGTSLAEQGIPVDKVNIHIRR